MQRLITLALCLLLLGNFAWADNSTDNDELQQRTQDRNAMIGASLQRKLDALLDDCMREDARFREEGLVAQRQYISGNLFAAAL
jgi:hypothetical protein